MYYTITDAIGTAGTITVDAGTDEAHEAILAMFPESPAEIADDIIHLCDSLGVRHASWCDATTDRLGVHVEPTR